MIYHVIPKLVKQPTWGGDYISNTKNLGLKDIRIGQSYEFSSNSKLVSAVALENLKPEKYPYYIGSNDVKDEELVNKPKEIVTLKDINNMEMFGTKEIPDLLIKFTQAKGNSYQLHPKVNTGKFRPKAESWYYFEKGKATLGIKPNINLEDYKNTCENIYQQTKSLSKKVKSGEITINEARKELYKFIELYNPEDFVNTEFIDKDGIVDNYFGGVHHSWEEDVYEIPNGNIVYEVQQDVPDNKSTIRSFDKGKLLDDGSFRELNIKEYFENLNLGRRSNDPTKLIINRLRLKDLKEWSLSKIFNNAYYQMDELTVKTEFKLSDLGFRHIYIKRGTGLMKVGKEKVTISKGHSYLLPASEDKVSIKNLGKDETETMGILMTYLKS